MDSFDDNSIRLNEMAVNHIVQTFLLKHVRQARQAQIILLATTDIGIAAPQLSRGNQQYTHFWISNLAFCIDCVINICKKCNAVNFVAKYCDLWRRQILIAVA